jgi:antibiotic biosynthesis monooxygenase (ABM) superfamily enzyme
MFENYIKYLKDNPNGYWFKRKLYGWGWTPAKWQGWAVVLAFVVFLLVSGFDLGENPTNSDLILFFVKLFLAVAIIILIGYKTGEKPCWQWGLPKQDNKL